MINQVRGQAVILDDGSRAKFLRRLVGELSKCGRNPNQVEIENNKGFLQAIHISRIVDWCPVCQPQKSTIPSPDYKPVDFPCIDVSKLGRRPRCGATK